jgi:hypothetical protein
VFSEANVFNTTHILKLQDEGYQVEVIKGFVTCKHDTNWWLECVVQVNDNGIQLTFLHPSGHSKFFMYPSLLHILWVPVSKVDPETATGHTYVISEKKSYCTTEKLETRLHRL